MSTFLLNPAFLAHSTTETNFQLLWCHFSATTSLVGCHFTHSWQRQWGREASKRSWFQLLLVHISIILQEQRIQRVSDMLDERCRDWLRIKLLHMYQQKLRVFSQSCTDAVMICSRFQEAFHCLSWFQLVVCSALRTTPTSYNYPQRSVSNFHVGTSFL